MSKLDSPVWFVTGASSGIGLALAETVLQASQRVVCTHRSESPALSALRVAYPDTCRLVKLEVTDPASVHQALADCLDTFGRLDVLVNNAGYGLIGVLEEMTAAQIRHQIEVNLTGLILLTQTALPHLRAQGNGYIVNVASVAGLRGMIGGTLYSATKFGVVGFTESLAQEVGPLGIRVSVIEPGPYRTDWAGRSLTQTPGMAAPDPTSPYAETNQKLRRWNDTANGTQPGDPKQIAEALLAAYAMPKPPLHMVFGDEAIAWFQNRLEQYNDSAFMARYPHGTTQPS